MAKNKTILQLDELTKPKGSDNFVVASTDNDFRLSLQTLQDAIGTNVVDPKIKELQQALNGKAGAFHNDEENNRCLVFADSESRSAYLADTSRTDLILGVINVGADMGDISGAIINLQSPMYNTIRLGSTGNYISFTFDITNKNGMSTGEPATCTYTFRKASNVQTVTEQYPAGKAVRFNIDKYLSEGTNQITVNIQGVDTGASVSVGVTYQVVSLTLSCDYNLAQVYNLSNSSQTLSAEFTVSGYGSKQLEWYIDGEKLAFDSIIDEVVTESAIRTKYIQLSDMQNGVHNLQVRARTTVDGEVFYSDTEYREFMVHNGVSTTPLAAIAMTVPSEHGIISEKRLYSMQQYVSYNLEFATYNPESSTIEVSVLIDDTQQGLLTSENGTANKITLSPIKSGEAVLKLVLGEQEYTINADIAQSSIAVTEISNALQLDFRALGKSNNATDKDSWSYGNYTGEFNGFNWNSTSGWVNNALHINAGATFDIDLAPLGVNPATLGKTIEIEFASTNVNDDNAVLLDLTNADGTGLLITATNIKLTSQAGVTIETSYKDNEFIRVAFVINKSSGATNKCLSFIYINGIVSRGIAWASTDKYTSNKTLHFVGSEGAEMLLKSVRIYDMALTSDQVLNNYTLYRDTAVEMIDVYERNDVYADNSSSFDYTKMMSRLPVMVITGNIPALEATSDKNLQITVDVEYFNLQDPSRSFKMKNAALRPQGTSSMGYPKKNFRLYTEKRDDTEVYDANGYKVENKKYAFTKNAQPVNCWCFKADYAESSGTHNTGIARLWNDVLVNTKIDEDYKLRTTAQKAAIAANYDYDVRTTIDGFPILMFYRLSENDPLVFIGKYNFNNDKSTESVFGFVDIPGFDNAKMQCWEVLNNGNALALFTSVDNFDANWSDAFESRYPDTSDPDTSDLKAFCQWMTSVSAEDFKTQKWSHLDIYKVAAYYVYLMRFGAVDQTVKNSMFTSEDGEHFYFINYDNDTINGLTNEGKLVVPWNATRTTLGEDGEPYYAGPRSRLWNMLEADEEFMNIVRTVDEALYVAGLRYESVIEMFDDKQAAKWVERVYNQDAQYKYIGPYAESGVNNLFMLQGSRSQHRKYWLAKRFSYFDSIFVSGAYKAQAIELKCINNTPAGQQFTITAGTEMDYGYGINNNPREANITLAEDESHTFTTSEVVNLGDPIRIYAAPHIKALDLSAMTDRLAVVTISNVNDASLGSKFKKLIIGNPLKENTTVEDISGLTNAEKLEYLDVCNMKGLRALNLSNQPNIQYVNAKGSNIANIEFAKGAMLQTLHLPSAMNVLELEQLPYLKEVTSENNFVDVATIRIKRCPVFSSNFNFVYGWLIRTTIPQADLTLEMDNINWVDVSPERFAAICEAKNKGANISLKGTIKLTQTTQEQINAITAAFGASVFKPNNDLYIKAPDAIYLLGPNTILEGESAQYTAVVICENPGTAKFLITSGSRSGVNLDSTSGLLTSTENGVSDSTLTIQAMYTPTQGSTLRTTTTLTVKKRIYPTSITLNGDTNPSKDTTTYTWASTTSTTDFTGDIIAEWSLTGDITNYRQIQASDAQSCVLTAIGNPTGSADGVLSLTLKKRIDNSTVTSATKQIQLLDPNVIMTSITNPEVMAIMYNNGLAANADYMTRDEAELVTADDFKSGSYSIFRNSKIKTFNEFAYFISVTSIGNSVFYGCSSLTSITIPDSVTSIGNSAFYDCSSLTSITIPDSVTSIGNSAFYNCSSLTSITIPDSVTSIGSSAFYNCSSLTSITIPDSVTSIGNSAFYDCSSLTSITIPDSVTSIGSYAFYDCSSLTSITIPDSVTSIGNSVFYGCSSLTSITIPDSVTSIGSYVFYGCSSLTSITIPDSVTSIGNSAFYDCSSLTSITIPDSVTSIGNSAFNNCSSLTSITVKNGNPKYDSRNNCNAIIETSTNVLIQGCLGTVIPDSVTSIGNSVFYGCSSLTSITIPDSVTSIGNSVFYGCSSLTSITIPDSVTSIGSYVFYGCSSLTSITIPDSVTSIGNSAFYNCSSLTSITIPDSVTSIGSYAFYDCSSLKEIVCRAATAPITYSYTFGSTTYSYTGRNTYNTGENKLYVPVGATGYDSSYWASVLCDATKCGFTISYTL